MAPKTNENNVNEGVFRKIAQVACNGCDLVTTEENKLTTDEVVEAGVLTINDFSVCTIDGDKVGVVTFVEKPGKYYWGGQAVTAMVEAFIAVFDGDEHAAREQYANEEKVRVNFERVKTKNQMTFTKVTVV